MHYLLLTRKRICLKIDSLTQRSTFSLIIQANTSSVFFFQFLSVVSILDLSSGYSDRPKLKHNCKYLRHWVLFLIVFNKPLQSRYVIYYTIDY